MEEHSVNSKEGDNMKFAEEMTEQQRNETLNEINDTIVTVYVL